jgi:hypothetical protein
MTGWVSIDPALGLLFVNVMHVGQWGHMEKRVRVRRASRTGHAVLGSRREYRAGVAFGEMMRSIWLPAILPGDALGE